MLGAFFDDSGTHTSSEVMVLGGVMGTDQQWDDFAVRWRALLANPLPGKPKLKQFHLAPCRNGQGEFLDYSPAERDHINHQFRKIIVEVEMVTVAAAVDKQAWDEIIVGELVEQLGKPMELLFVKCVDSLVSIIRQQKPHEQVWLFFDQALRRQLYAWGQLYLSQKEKYPEIGAVVFAPVPNVEALQAADLIAYESYLYGLEVLRNGPNAKPHPHFEEFIWRDLSGAVIMNREMIAEVAENVRRKMRA